MYLSLSKYCSMYKATDKGSRHLFLMFISLLVSSTCFTLDEEKYIKFPYRELSFFLIIIKSLCPNLTDY